MPFNEKITFLNQFSRFFEENMKTDFLTNLKKYDGEKVDLHVYLTCLSMLYN